MWQIFQALDFCCWLLAVRDIDSVVHAVCVSLSTNLLHKPHDFPL